jgi:hypothetical protein
MSLIWSHKPIIEGGDPYCAAWGRTWTGGAIVVEVLLGSNASDNGASHYCNIIGDQTLYVGVLYAAGVNVGSRAHYIDTGGEATTP